MSRKNYVPKPRVNKFKGLDVVDVYEPCYSHIRRWVSIPRKVIYIKRAANPDAKIIRIGWSGDDNMFTLPFED